MPDRVLNTLLEDQPQYDKYAMTVMKGRKPVLPPNDPRAEKPEKPKKKSQVIEVDPGTLTNESWADVDTNNSMMQVDVAATAITGGVNVFSGYFTGAAKNISDSDQGLLSKTVLWERLGSETGILTLAAVRSGATDADILAALLWDEIR